METDYSAEMYNVVDLELASDTEMSEVDDLELPLDQIQQL